MKILTMRQFGKMGRAGNQFFQYAFLTGYAAKHSLELQLPRWVGTDLFGTSHPTCSAYLPDWIEPGSGLKHPTPPNDGELIGHNFCGYAQYHTSCFADDKERIRSLFAPVTEVATRLDEPVKRLLDAGTTAVGIHLRRGDYGRNIFPITPVSWYLKWLDENWDRLNDPMLFIATEDARLVSDFAKYKPHTTETLGVNLADQPMADCVYLDRDLVTKDRRALDWYPDFHLLSQCEIVLGPSSTFSFFAAMLNPYLKEYHRATLTTAGFVRTDPWDAYPLMREHVRDYPQLEGIAMTSNPYW